MSNKYVIKFAKEGYIKYTSHLDMLRLFKRAFKKCGIRLAHSQGFNPHPKMGFAQPLSLGYTSRCELLEFETMESQSTADLKEKLAAMMPMGIEILAAAPLNVSAKSLAGVVDEALYKVVFPVDASSADFDKIVADYLAQDEILAEKRQKKTKKMATVDIRGKIRKIAVGEGERLTLMMNLDCGSISNLSPEQVIASFVKFAELPIDRYDIEVERLEIMFEKKAGIKLQF
ncbi:MAG: TIGR03936 family radical SAM-associated protein [Firmicutes bacterium]|nr:TIGR03936 family radical SAM-associated protein [Bacillota bacterium]